MNLKWFVGFVVALVGWFIPVVGWVTLVPLGRKLMKQAKRDADLKRQARQAVIQSADQE